MKKNNGLIGCKPRAPFCYSGDGGELNPPSRAELQGYATGLADIFSRPPGPYRPSSAGPADIFLGSLYRREATAPRLIGTYSHPIGGEQERCSGLLGR